MLSNMPKVPLQLQRQRQNRHIKLMNMINSYQLTKQQKSKLQKIKSHTMMEISLRYLRSQINRNYKFPKVNKTVMNIHQQQQIDLLNSENQSQEDKLLRQELEEKRMEGSKKKKRNAQAFFYDLRSQNVKKEVKEVKQPEIVQISIKNKFLPLEQSRRVHSLGNQRSQEKQKDDFIIRRHMALKRSNQRYAKSPPFIQSKSTKSLKTIKLISQTRKPSKQHFLLQQSLQKSPKTMNNSNQQNLLVDNRKLKLPQINSSSNSKSLKKLVPIHQQKLKTQKIFQQQDIQAAIGKKLNTQISDSGKKMTKGVEKYLKDLQNDKKYNLNSLSSNQGSTMLKKEEKLKGSFGLIKTTKNSLKMQVDKDLS